VTSFLFKYHERPDGKVTIQVFAGESRARRGPCGNMTMQVKAWKALRAVLESCPTVDIQVSSAEKLRQQRLLRRAEGYDL
jgi:hypothetical protein